MSLQDTAIVDSITKGDYEQIEVTIRKPDGSAQNLTGYRLVFGAKFDISDTVVRMPKDTNNVGDFDMTDIPNGIVRILIDTDDLDFITYETTLIGTIKAIDNQGRPASTRFRIPVEIGTAG